MSALDDARQLIASLECTTPAHGHESYAHCAACCYGTGYTPSCEEEAEALNAALVLVGQHPIDWYR
jgi:hypothetical protein